MKTNKMNLDQVSPEEQIKICRKYFIIGCFGLPFVWLVNSIWFFRQAFIRKGSPRKMKMYLLGSMIGFLVWTLVFIVWTVVYQTQRVFWGDAGVRISFVVPAGKL